MSAVLWLTCTSILSFVLVKSQTISYSTNNFGNSALVSSGCPSQSQCYQLRGNNQGYVTYTMSTTGYQDISVTFNMDVAVGNGESCDLEYSTSGTTSYTILQQYSSDTGSTTVQFPAAINDDSSFQVRFINRGNHQNQDNCYIDAAPTFTATAIVITAEPTMKPTIKPTTSSGSGGGTTPTTKTPTTKAPTSSSGSSGNSYSGGGSRNRGIEQITFNPFANGAYFGVFIAVVCGLGLFMSPLTYPIWRMIKDCIIDSDAAKTNGKVIKTKQKKTTTGRRNGQRGKSRHTHFVVFKYKGPNGEWYEDERQVFLVKNTNMNDIVANATAFANLKPGNKVDVTYSKKYPRLNKKEFICVYASYPCCGGTAAYICLIIMMSIIFFPILGVVIFGFGLWMNNAAGIIILCLILSIIMICVPCGAFIIRKDIATPLNV